MNPRYAAWVRCGKPGPFPCWIASAINEAHKAGNTSVAAESSKWCSKPLIRVVSQHGFTEWCNYFADNYCATETPMLHHTYLRRTT